MVIAVEIVALERAGDRLLSATDVNNVGDID